MHHGAWLGKPWNRPMRIPHGNCVDLVVLGFIPADSGGVPEEMPSNGVSFGFVLLK